MPSSSCRRWLSAAALTGPLVLPTSAASAASAASTPVELSAGGPYRVAPGGRIPLVGRYALAGQSATVADLTAIGAALERYRAANGSYPPVALTDAAGRPTLSWRVLLLPYLGQDALYRRFDLTKAWDDPANRRLLASIPAVYRGGRRSGTNTAYAGVAGTKHLFRSAAATLGGGVRQADVTDGTTMTAAAGPVGSAVQIPWTAPVDIDPTEHPSLGDRSGFAGAGGAATPLLFLDGSVHTIPNDAGSGLLTDWATVAGGGCAPPDGLAVDLRAGWDLDGDGTYESVGRTASFVATSTGTRTVRFRVQDARGRSFVTTAKVVVR